MAKDSDERLLGYVFRVADVADDAYGESEQATLIAPNEHKS
jgi:hypothetical protein